LAFKQALEQKLKNGATTEQELIRAHQLVVFERLLARLTLEFGDALTLKGGLVLEHRLERARTMRDVDLRLVGLSADEAIRRAEAVAAEDVGDFMRFKLERDPRRPTLLGDGVVYEGIRLPAQCVLAGKQYGGRFGVDLPFGDPLVRDRTALAPSSTLDFAGIRGPDLKLYPVATHVAEKLHADTLPRERLNSRIKDLPDIALLATVGPVDTAELRLAIETTFGFRDTHPAPEVLPEPQNEGEAPYAEMASSQGLVWRAVTWVFGAVGEFLDPVLLDSTLEAKWSPETGAWVTPRWGVGRRFGTNAIYPQIYPQSARVWPETPLFGGVRRPWPRLGCDLRFARNADATWLRACPAKTSKGDSLPCLAAQSESPIKKWRWGPLSSSHTSLFLLFFSMPTRLPYPH
jgi:hypothetical protein